MSNTNTGGPAFPLPPHTKRWDDVEKCYVQDEGMTLRDYFAAKAMQGICNTRSHTDLKGHVTASAKVAYAMADAMLSARGTEKAKETK